MMDKFIDWERLEEIEQGRIDILYKLEIGNNIILVGVDQYNFRIVITLDKNGNVVNVSV
jgi:hypothetical protein